MFADKVLKALSKNENLNYVLWSKDREKHIDLLSMVTSPDLKWAPTQFFDFGYISFDELMVEYEPSRELFLEGFLPLPATRCFLSYETQVSYTANERAVEANLHSKSNKKMHVGIFIFAPFTDLPASENDWIIVPICGEDLVLGRRLVPAFHLNIETQTISVESDPKEYSELDRTNVASTRMAMTAMLGRLNSEGIAREVVTPPEKLSKKRRKSGLPEMVKHTVVTVRPYRAPLGSSGPRLNDEYTPKRYHFRRGHVRRFKNGGKTLVRPCFVGTPENGRIEHQYRVKAA
jgi:hypothetical protein